jgi:holo-[acyl-carrier protein] synthase
MFSVQALGVDLLHSQRVTRPLKRFGLRWLEAFLTLEELWDCVPQQYLSASHTPELLRQTIVETYPHWHAEAWRRVSGKIAVKEAVAKALGVGLCGLGYGEGIRWHEVQVLPESATKRRPCVTLEGYAKQCQTALGITHWLVSISHDEGLVFAQVLGMNA